MSEDICLCASLRSAHKPFEISFVFERNNQETKAGAKRLLSLDTTTRSVGVCCHISLIYFISIFSFAQQRTLP